MGKKSDLQLVRKQFGLVEKTAPGVRQIVSGIVADMLALAKGVQLAKAPLSLLIGDFESRNSVFVDKVIQKSLDQRYKLSFTYFHDTKGLLKLSREKKFDLVAIWLNNVHWDVPDETVKFLANYKAQYGGPILTIGNAWWADDFVARGLEKEGIHFLEAPFDMDTLTKSLRNCLGFSL